MRPRAIDAPGRHKARSVVKPFAAAPQPSPDLSGLDIWSELESYRAALNRQAIVGITDRQGTIVSVNDLFCEVSGYSRAELIGRKHSLLNSGVHPRDFFKQMWRKIGSGQIWRGDICNRTKQGSLYWVDTTIVPRFDPEGRVSGYVSIRYDVTARKQAKADLIAENLRRERAELLLRDIIETIPDGVVAFDEADRLVLCNATYREQNALAAAAITEGATYETILRHSVERGQFVLPNGGRDAEEWIAARLAQHARGGRRSLLHLADGRWLQVEERRSTTGCLVSVTSDVTDLKRVERSVRDQAERDALTGLHNRRVMLDRLARLASGERKRDAALLLIDLDGFKIVNDSLGHDAGDQLLIEVADRLRRTMRASDVVTRLGGDEFAVITYNLRGHDAVERLADKVLRALEVPARIGNRLVSTGASIGIADLSNGGLSPTEALKRADLALYQAKARGRAMYVRYSGQLSRTLSRRRALARALRGAIDQHLIEVALQPQIDLKTGRHSGFEALVRWTHRGTPIPPPEIIAIAEESGIILDLDRRIVQRGLELMRDLRAQGHETGTIAFNISGSQLKADGLACVFAELIRDSGFQPADVEVEVTENVVLDAASDRILTTLRELDAIGVGNALDDFGTGFASLSHLKHIPLHRLKIDRSFVAGIGVDSSDEAIVRAIISLAHSLDLTVVAEGIETQAQYEFLTRHACDYAQGYLIGRPMFAAEVASYMLDHTSRDPGSSAAAQD